MRTSKLLTLLALLMTAATGAWAQSTTHIVKQDNVNTIFSGSGYTLGNTVKAGDVLDFQGTIELEGDASHSLVINKPVNIISSEKNAVIKLHTVAGSLTGDDPGNCFVINKAGSGTTVQDIRIENTETWIFNTSNVTFTGVTMWVEEARVGTGVGHVALRYSDHITFDGCTVYTKNNGGSSACVLTLSSNCTIKNTSIISEGNVGNCLILGNAVNVNDMPTDFPTSENVPHDNSVLNCTINSPAGGLSNPLQLAGYRHRVEGCTIVKGKPTTSFGGTLPDSPENGYIFRNNIFSNTNGTMTVFAYSTVEGNTITVTGNGKLTVNKGSTVTGNTINGNVEVSANSSDYTGSTITGNTINGTVTFSTNSKNNTLTRNVITSTGDYAVVMASTADANNTVQYNTLNAATKKGDEAVNPSTGTGNTISNNSNIALMLADGTKDAANWTAKVGEGDAQPLPVAGLNEGNAVTLQYTGRLKVKGVKATSDAAPAAAAFAADEYNEASWDGSKVVFTKKTAASTPTAVANSNTAVTWSDGWYTVAGEVTISGNVTLGADTYLILQDGAKLTINGQLDANTNQKNLYIYGQRKGDGKLNVTNSDDAIINSGAVNRIDIHGGEITAVSTNFRAIVTGILNVYSGKVTATSDGDNGTIQFCISFDVYGGEVEGTSNATSSDSPSRGISDGGYDKTLTIYGGKVTATGNGREGYGDYGSGINCYVKSGTSGIKFYFSDNGTTWGDGTSYASATSVGGSDDAEATKKRYVKAE